MSNPGAFPKRTKALTANFRKWCLTRHPNIDFLFDEPEQGMADPGIWWIRIRDISGKDDEFKGGEYIAQLLAPANYPFGPPEFYFQTPNGVYNTHKKVCISVGVYHAADYPATLGMGGFSKELPNGMISWRDMGSGLELVANEYHSAHKEQKPRLDAQYSNNIKSLAAASYAYNRKNPMLAKLIKRFEALPGNLAVATVPRLNLDKKMETLVLKYLTS